MRKFRHIVSIAVAGAVVLLVTTCLATAAEAEQRLAKTAPATGKTTRCIGTYYFYCTCSGQFCFSEFDDEGPCKGN